MSVIFDTNMAGPDAKRALETLVRTIGWENIERRVNNLENEYKSRPQTKEYIEHIFRREFCIYDMISRKKLTGRLDFPPKSNQQYDCYSLSCMLERIISTIGEKGRRKLVGHLRGSLNKEYGLAPISYEMEVLCHLMSSGFSIDLNDLEGDGGFDFLATRDGIEVEVECKHISEDIGRQVPMYTFRKFCDDVQRYLDGLSFDLYKDIYVNITVKSRFKADNKFQNTILDALNYCIVNKSNFCNNSMHIRISELNRNVKDMIENCNSEEILRRNIFSAIGAENKNVMMLGNNLGLFLLCIDSERPDRVLEKIFRKLKEDSKNQFSGERPAFLCVHLSSVSKENLANLIEHEKKGKTGLQIMANSLLSKRPHLHTVSFSVDGDVKIRDSIDNFGKIRREYQGHMPAYILKNPNHPLSKCVILDCF